MLRFHQCRHGLHNFNENELDDNARGSLKTIKEIMDTSGIDDSAERGTAIIRAEQLSLGERDNFSEAVSELAYWFEVKFHDATAPRQK